MSRFGRFLQNSSPMVKMLVAISITSALIASHKLFIAPYRRKMRYLKSEEWASHIIEEEEKATESNEMI